MLTPRCESGSGFDIRASIGYVGLPAEAADTSTALRLADQRMYTQNNERASSVNQQLRDVILRVLAAQDGELYNHVHEVTRLAAAVGRRLGLDDVASPTVLRAAELHDVGKVAIPESILQKPGPLAPEERQLMRRHTLIGESILSAASALAGVGRLCARATSATTAPAIPTSCRTTSRFPAASSSSATPSTP